MDNPELDYSRVHTLYMVGGHTISIKVGTYREYQLDTKREMFVAALADYFFEATRVISQSTVAGATDSIIAMGFMDAPSTD